MWLKSGMFRYYLFHLMYECLPGAEKTLLEPGATVKRTSKLTWNILG